MKIPIQISEDSREPIYHQIEIQIKTLIVGGILLPGNPLPSIRSLAGDLGCSVITTRRAYQNLEATGLIKTVQGKGTFVCEMESDERNETKKRVMYETLEKAVEQGIQFGYSKEEINDIFKNVMKEKF